ncbi:hypothetical protein L3Q65_00810 (plasmid) [Amycolatopsis sp. FU40]|uniref:hypothetical protein n=1 Tax=Amycolatopsis sp. FU40 TaxID=2914159 RepID=UPI001F34BAD2|nr:hypothetical protein [Amycolatopsis sp. FU40]UKD50866.1 hypothetical protein L3Q65_00810 [Amycolatopsis sp. FU40]
MTTRVYKITLAPEDTDIRVAYMVDRSGAASVTEETASDAFDPILCDNDGYVIDAFQEIAEGDIPASASPYWVG